MGIVLSICFEWSAPTLAPAMSLKSASLRRLRSLTPWAIQDSREFLVRTKKFAIKEHIQCKFEGLGSSERCRCEDFKQQKGQPAIVGLHSNWVTDNIVATARPSDALIGDYSVLEQFAKCGLGAIFNLQEPGEHGDCGPGIKVESGFSYTPESLMRNKIFYYNFPWRDMTCPSVEYTLNIVAVMDFHISKGAKVAVHCHSGLGRTGLVIACYLVYTGQRNAVGAVELVRMHRFATIFPSDSTYFYQELFKQNNKCCT
ncbi:protein tyrosine phosphatase domain-containing protein 1-like isoform X2 [Selaginella moellendorffii]|uniref:protein tyrosine phosphatase domain-containing protein 1-like isoform X2 n=1 Tax=Selaginella moellendorffii TaxID=88036 RepID=UPI000D1C9CB5|nr:protein tyrosine phosphatase domain-containing protein 1-like isoform X2 [Selaginella moellendorffii]XP_024538161.1 protein tyrosine phosphatase domain-containing protein 1-like isoform X2 [Selaginella moellendorffii]|eukprot:XP_024535677.1 protein tyrosine phosphatase domain-containing protein 1-like isoform X2 [Selaginella moellendorffii]